MSDTQKPAGNIGWNKPAKNYLNNAQMQPPVQTKYILKSTMILRGSTIVPEGSQMAAMMVDRQFDEGMELDGLLYPPNPNVESPERFEFIADGGRMNNGTHYNGKVRYTLNTEDDIPLQIDYAQETDDAVGKVVHLRTQQQKNMDLAIKVGVGVASIGAGYAIAKVLKKKPLVPMIVTPLIVFGGLLLLDLKSAKKI